MKKISFVFAIVITQLLLLAGCKNMLSTELQDSSSTVEVSFSVNVDKARTVMPERVKFQDLTSITLYGNIEGAEEELIKSWKTSGDFEKDKITLEKANWNFRLTAAYAERECFEGKTTANLTQTNTVEFELKTVSEGAGDINISLYLTNPADTITEYEYFILPIKDAVDEYDFDFEIFEEAYFDENGKPKSELYKKNRIGGLSTEDTEEKIEKIDIIEKDLQSNVYYLSLWVYGFDSDEKSFDLSYDTIIVVTPGHISSAEIELGNVLANVEPNKYTVTFIDGSMSNDFFEGKKLQTSILEELSSFYNVPVFNSFVYYDNNNDLQLWDMERDVVTSNISLYPAYEYSEIKKVLEGITGTPDFTLYFYDMEPELGEPDESGYYYFNQEAINTISTSASSVKLDLSLVKMGCGWDEDAGKMSYVTQIPENFCKSCTWLEEITLPMQKDALYTHVEKDAFYGCSNLKSIYFNGGIYDDDHPLSSRAGEDFSAFGATKTTDGKGSTVFVSYYKGCTSLENIYWKGDVASYLTAFQFDGNSNPDYFSVSPFTSSEAEEKNIYFLENNDWKLAENVTVTSTQATEMNHYYGAHAFEHCTSIKQATVDGVSKYPEGIFTNCPNLTTIKISTENSAIGVREFLNCTSLAAVELERCTVESDAFTNCTSLNKLVLNACTINGNAFYECTALTDVTFVTNSNIEQYAFNGCESLTQVKLKNEVDKTEWILYKDGKCTGSVDDIRDFIGLNNIFDREPNCQIKKLSMEKFPHKDIDLQFNNETGELYTTILSDTKGYEFEYEWYEEGTKMEGVGSSSINVKERNVIQNSISGEWTTYTLVAKDSSGNYYSQCIQLMNNEGSIVPSETSGTFFDGIVTDGKELTLQLFNAETVTDNKQNPVIQTISEFDVFDKQNVYLDLSNYNLIEGQTEYELKLYNPSEDDSAQYRIACSFEPDTTENTIYFTPSYGTEERGINITLPNTYSNNKVTIRLQGLIDTSRNHDLCRDPTNPSAQSFGIWDGLTCRIFSNGNWLLWNQYLMTVTVYSDDANPQPIGYFQSVLYFTVGGNTITIPEIKNLNP